MHAWFVVGLRDEVRIATWKLALLQFGGVPALDEVTPNIACAAAIHGAGHIVPRHSRNRNTVDEIIERLRNVHTVLLYPVHVILPDPHLFFKRFRGVGCRRRLLIGSERSQPIINFEWQSTTIIWIDCSMNCDTPSTTVYLSCFLFSDRTKINGCLMRGGMGWGSEK